MSDPAFTVAVVERPHTRELGSVAADDHDIEVEFAPFDEIRRGFLGEGRWHAAEVPLGRYIALKAAGDDSLTAIPVFPWRSFRHGAIHVRDDGSVRTPAQLEGRRVGVTDWYQTAGIVARGLLSIEYGVRLDRIDWVAGGLDGTPRASVAPVPEPRGFTVDRSDVPLAALLREGAIDAIIAADAPAGGGTRTLLPNHEEAEAAWFEQTGIFPLMHVVAIRKAALGGGPSPEELRRLFERAKDASGPQAQDAKWRYGLEENSAALERLLADAFAQGVGERRLEAKSLFTNTI